MLGNSLKQVCSQASPARNRSVLRQVFLIAALALCLAANNTKKIPETEKTLDSGSVFLRAGEIRKAAAVFRAVLASALRARDDYYAARARIGLAGCALITHDYRDAVRDGESALRYGLATNDTDIAVRAALNLSSLYRLMGDFRAAAQTMRDLNPILAQVTDPPLKAPLYLHAAGNLARNGDTERAEPLFYAGIDSALARGDQPTAATGWNQLGYMWLQHGNLGKADTALTEAFRLRRLAGNRSLAGSYTYLGMLRLTQGDARSALNLLDNAVRIASVSDVPIPVSMIYYWRAKAKTALSDIPGALADFDRGIRWAARWRHEVLPSDGFRITAEVGLDHLYDEYVQLGMRASKTTGNVGLAKRMFEVSEQHRSASFRESMRTGRKLPAEYWEALASYRKALAASLKGPKTGVLDHERLRLARIEASLGLESAYDNNTRVRDIQRRLGPEESLISFHTGEEQSYVWAITRNGFEWRPLDGLREIRPLAKQYRDALAQDAPVEVSNIRLYGMLFSSLTPQIQAKRDWLLSLDEGLYDLPFAALGPAKQPLMLFHSLRFVPGAALLNRPGRPAVSSDFIGAGDGIYNVADPRWTGAKKSKGTAYARLINTRQEVLTVARAWTADPQPTLLFGESFSRDSLDRAMANGAAIVHIAAHVVNGKEPGQVMIGLGLAKDGSLDYMTPADIASRPAPVGLVSVNGCASGSGVVLRGSGLIGLTRAWLLSGATAVAATYWPVNDDRGELFSEMYSRIGRGSERTVTAAKAAKALQEAQISCWRSNTSRARPGYWAAVFVAGKH
jgi:CHAT domain-containing protein